MEDDVSEPGQTLSDTPADGSHTLDADAVPIFQRTVAPGLQAVEAERLRQRSVLVRRLALFFGAVAPAMGLAVWATDGHRGVIFGCMVAIVAAILWIHTPMHRHRKQARDEVIGAICDSLGELTFEPYHNPSLNTFPEIEGYAAAGLIRTHGFSRRLDKFSHRVDDLMAGAHLGTSFEVRRVWIGIAGKGGRTDFHGLLGTIALPFEFGGVTKIAPIEGGAEGLEPVRTGHAAFDDRFDVFTDRPEEVRQFLSPRFLDEFVALQTDHRPRGRHLRATFTDGRLLFALDHAGSIFEPAGLHLSPQAAQARRRELVSEVVIPHRLIAGVCADRSIGAI